jgi:hypothetical protein
MLGEVLLSMGLLDAARCSSYSRRVPYFLLEKDLSHHAFVLMAQQMAVEERHAPDDRVCEIHHQINITFNRDIDRVKPFWTLEPHSVLGINEEVNLMNVKRVHLVRAIRDSPVMKSSDGYSRHGWI